MIQHSIKRSVRAVMGQRFMLEGGTLCIIVASYLCLMIYRELLFMFPKACHEILAGHITKWGYWLNLKFAPLLIDRYIPSEINAMLSFGNLLLHYSLFFVDCTFFSRFSEDHCWKIYVIFSSILSSLSRGDIGQDHTPGIALLYGSFVSKIHDLMIQSSICLNGKQV